MASNILETFYLVFETNHREIVQETKKIEQNVEDIKKEVDKVDKAFEKAEKTVEDVKQEVNKLDKAFDKVDETVKTVEKNVGKAGNSFVKFGTSALKSLGPLVAAIGGMASVLDNASNLAAIGTAAETLGMSANDVNAFGQAIKTVGGDAEGARDVLIDVAEKAGEALQDTESGAAKSFESLGISLKDSSGKAKDALSVFLDLAEATEGLSKDEAIFRVKELGITDNKAVSLITKGRKEIEAVITQQKKQSPITEKNVEDAQAFQKAWHSLTTTFSAGVTNTNNLVLPSLTFLLNGIEKLIQFLIDHKEFVLGFFIGIAAVATPAMISLAAATLTAVAPFLLIGAAVAALGVGIGLLVDDIMGFFRGDASVTSVVVEAFKGMVEKVKKSMDDFSLAMLAPVYWIFQMYKFLFEKIFGFVSDSAAKVKDSIVGLLPDTILGFEVGAAFKDKPKTTEDNLMTTMGVASNEMLAANQTAPQAMAARIATNAMSNKTINANTGPITIQTSASTLSGVTSDAGKQISDMLANAVNSADDGVAG